jgi:hypothetical protein
LGEIAEVGEIEKKFGRDVVVVVSNAEGIENEVRVGKYEYLGKDFEVYLGKYKGIDVINIKGEFEGGYIRVYLSVILDLIAGKLSKDLNKQITSINLVGKKHLLLHPELVNDEFSQRYNALFRVLSWGYIDVGKEVDLAEISKGIININPVYTKESIINPQAIIESMQYQAELSDLKKNFKTFIEQKLHPGYLRSKFYSEMVNRYSANELWMLFSKIYIPINIKGANDEQVKESYKQYVERGVSGVIIRGVTSENLEVLEGLNEIKKEIGGTVILSVDEGLIGSVKAVAGWIDGIEIDYDLGSSNLEKLLSLRKENPNLQISFKTERILSDEERNELESLGIKIHRVVENEKNIIDRTDIYELKITDENRDNIKNIFSEAIRLGVEGIVLPEVEAVSHNENNVSNISFGVIDELLMQALSSYKATIESFFYRGLTEAKVVVSRLNKQQKEKLLSSNELKSKVYEFIDMVNRKEKEMGVKNYENKVEEIKKIFAEVGIDTKYIDRILNNFRIYQDVLYVVISDAYGYIEGIISEIIFERNNYKFDKEYEFMARHLVVLLESYIVRSEDGKISGVKEGLTDLEKASVLSVAFRYYNKEDKESILEVIKNQIGSFSDIAKLVLISDYYQATGELLVNPAEIKRIISEIERDTIDKKIIINYVVSALKETDKEVMKYYEVISGDDIKQYGIKDGDVLVPWLLIMHTLTYKNLNLNKPTAEVLSTMRQNINLLTNMLQTRYTIPEKIEQQIPYNFVGEITEPIAISRMFEIFNLLNTENMKQILKEKSSATISVDAIKSLLGAV